MRPDSLHTCIALIYSLGVVFHLVEWEKWLHLYLVDNLV